MARWMSDETTRVCKESGRLPVHVDILDWDTEDLLLTSRRINGAKPSVTIIGGSITTDQSRDIPGTGTLQVLLDPETIDAALPLTSTSPLSPVAGALVQVYFGHEDEWTPYGRYEVVSVNPEEQGEGVAMSVELADVSRRLDRVKFFRPRTIARGTNYVDVFKDLIWQVVPKANLTIYPYTRPAALHTYNVGDDRLTAIYEFVDAVASYINFNYQGTGEILIQPWPTDNQDPVFYFSESDDKPGVKDGVLVKVSRVLTDENAYNGVICSGEAAGSDKPPVRGEWWDYNTSSPTYFDPDKPLESSYGAVPYFMTSPVIRSTTQAVEAARAKLPQVAGMTERLQLECVRHPGVEPGDAIYVERPRIGAKGVYIVEATSMPFLAADGLMSITCRERRVFQ